MPTYIEMLRMADYEAIWRNPTFYFQNGGPFVLLALVFLVVSWALMLSGLFPGKRKLIGYGMMGAFVSSLLGWLGSYMGYGSAAAVVAANTIPPRTSELESAANHMAFCAIAPSVAMVGTFLAGMVLLAVVASFGGRKANG